MRPGFFKMLPNFWSNFGIINKTWSATIDRTINTFRDRFTMPKPVLQYLDIIELKIPWIIIPFFLGTRTVFWGNLLYCFIQCRSLQPRMVTFKMRLYICCNKASIRNCCSATLRTRNMVRCVCRWFEMFPVITMPKLGLQISSTVHWTYILTE